ncbi:MAG: hypothetical protein AAGG48_30060 [Planctomycetota bacterium]
MRSSFVLLLLLPIAIGCSSQQASDVRKGAKATPTPEEESQRDLGTTEGVTAMLEQRWSLDSIRTFCIPERRHNPAYQNLVAEGDTWEGQLHPHAETGFDRIFWYATTQDDRLAEYSLNVQRGTDFWLLEIGNLESLKNQPDFEPDPSEPHFVGAEK